MVTTKQMNIKTRNYYFYNEVINIKNFDPKLLTLDKKSLKDIFMYYIGYVTKKDEYKINSLNPLYLLVHEIDDFVEEKECSKYLNISLTDSNSEVLKKYAEIWSGTSRNLELGQTSAKRAMTFVLGLY